MKTGQKLTKWWHFCRNFFEYFLLTINHHGITLWAVTKIICVLSIGIGNNGIYFQNTQKVTNNKFPSSKILPTFQHSSDIPKLLTGIPMSITDIPMSITDIPKSMTDIFCIADFFHKNVVRMFPH